MKKKYILFAMALGLLTACDPIKEEGDLAIDNFTSEQLLEGATFEQFDAVTNEDGTVTYTPSETGNYIEYSIPRVSAVTIYYVKNGAEMQLAYGKSAGMFTFIPSRGSNPVQTVYFRFINADGEEVVATKDFTLTVAADLTAEMKLLVGNDGQKVWKWDTSAPNGRVWGNMGTNFDGRDFALTGNGQWWGVTSEEEFMGQLNHTDDGQAHGDESMDATMVITEDGMIYTYDAEGNEIRSGKVSVSNYDASYGTDARYCGILNTDAGSIMFPYEINSNGNKPTLFYIAYLTPGRMVLVYPDEGDWSNSGGEATYWQFCSSSDISGLLTGNSEATWQWDTDSEFCWGNGSYSGFAYAGAASVTSGQWWGVPQAGTIDEQITSYGYEFNDNLDATMTFSSDGSLTKSSGGTGGFSYDTTTEDVGGFNEGKTMGRLSTTGDGILFPIQINTGNVIEEFDIAYISETNLVLTVPTKTKADGGNSWDEGTFWRFKKVK